MSGRLDRGHLQMDIMEAPFGGSGAFLTCISLRRLYGFRTLSLWCQYT